MGEPDLRIVREIRILREQARAGRIVNGGGIVTEHRPGGTRLRVAGEDGDASEASAIGMFAIQCVPQESGMPLLTVSDTSPAATETSSAGIAYANSYAFEPAAFSARLRKSGTTCVFLHFDLSGYAAAVASVSQGNSPHAYTPTCAIQQADALPKSTFAHLYYLLGRVAYDQQDKTIAVSQDHAPGPVHALWHGPFLGLAEDNPLLEG